MPDGLLCHRCGTELTPGSGQFFIVHIEAVADPTPPEITADELRRDLRRDMARLVAQMRDRSERELLDDVYRRLTITLCGPCYRTWIENPAGPER